MKKYLLGIFLTLFLFVKGDCQSFQTSSTYTIPAGGATITISNIAIPAMIKVSCNGATTLASGYTLQYSALPLLGANWKVYCDFSNLDANGQEVTIFGQHPLTSFKGVTTFYIAYWVDYSSAGSLVLNNAYFSSLQDLTNFYDNVTFHGTATFDSTAIFNQTANFNDTVNLNGVVNATALSQTADSTLRVGAAGTISKGCVPWCTTGNSGLSNSNFLGNTDTVGLNFRVNNYPSGRIDYNLANTSFGYGANHNNTSGSENTAIGLNSLFANTTGASNVSIGKISLASNTTGGSNTGIGTQSMNGNISGSSNTGVGFDAGTNNITGSFNTSIGSGADISTSSTHNATSLGYNAIAGNYGIQLGAGTASANQLGISSDVSQIYFPGHTSALNYVMTDTSGTGNFIPKQPYLCEQTYRTPITGDSSVITTSANLVNPAGTIANYTIILPASPFSGQILEFSFTQIVTTLHWSTRLSSDVDAVDANVPVATTAGETIKIQFNSDTSTWYNY